MICALLDLNSPVLFVCSQDVAVTGIPEAQANHALNMVRFARDCLERMPVVTRLLAERLGEDTQDLGMRIGLHSGSTTAGVLRGTKGRFQVSPTFLRSLMKC